MIEFPHKSRWICLEWIFDQIEGDIGTEFRSSGLFSWDPASWGDSIEPGCKFSLAEIWCPGTAVHAVESIIPEEWSWESKS